MIYVVSGFRRSGTSMMMKALQAGGLDALYDGEQDEGLARGADDYYALQHGESVYEPARHRFQEWNWPLAYDGKLMKCLYGGLSQLAVNDSGYRYVFMLRDPEEIRQSDEARMLKKRTKAPAWLNDKEYYDRMFLAIDGLNNRMDTKSLAVFRYRELLEDPLAAFHELAVQGWPIDAEKAAAVVDPTMCRFKIEDLTLGV